MPRSAALSLLAAAALMVAAPSPAQAVTPDVSVTASNPVAGSTTTLTYRATITRAGTLTAVQFAVPPGSGGRVTSINGTLRTYAPGYLRWTPTNPIPVRVGSRLSIPVYKLVLPGTAGTYRLGMNAVENRTYLTQGYGSLTTTPQPPAPMAPAPVTARPPVPASCPTTYPSIAAENALPGSTDWDITAQSPSLSLYADRTSAACGQTVGLRINSATPVTVTAYRMGYYGALGAREVWRSYQIPARIQPAPTLTNSNVSAANWAESARIHITGAFRPGVYLLKARNTVGEQSYAPLTVRDDTATRHDLLVQQATSTWQAYNTWGGASFYSGGSSTLSYDRPYNEGFGSGQYLPLERGLTYWAEAKGIDVAYWTDEDLHLYGSQLPQLAAALWLPAHDEYYSYPMRAALTQAIRAGVHVANLGANTVYREISYAASMRSWSISRAVFPASSTWRYRGPAWHEQTILGAQYGCAPRGALTTNGSWLWQGVAPGTVLDGFVNGENDYVQPGIWTPPGQVLLSSAPARCYRSNNVMQRVDIVAHTAPSGARVINGSTFTFGCFVVQQCPSGWRNSTDGPLVVTPAQSAAVAVALGNIARWHGVPAATSMDVPPLAARDDLPPLRVETEPATP